MGTEKPRVLITFEEDFLKRIDDYRFNNRFPSRNAAITNLIDIGLNQNDKLNDISSLENKLQVIENIFKSTSEEKDQMLLINKCLELDGERRTQQINTQKPKSKKIDFTVPTE